MRIRTVDQSASGAAVLAAYGFSVKKDLLAQLLALNQEVAGKIEEGSPVIAPGVPPNCSHAKKLVTEDFRRRLRALRGLCQDIVELRRGDHSGARLKMERERLEREREKTDAEVVAQFERWAKNPEVRDWICQAWISPEERQRRLREIFGLPPESPEEAPPTAPESNPVKPNPTQSKQTKPDEPVESEVGGASVP